MPVRLVGRDPGRLPELSGAAVAPPAPFADSEAMYTAFSGVHTVFLVSAQESPQRVHEHQVAVDAAVRAGVQRVVYASFLGAAPEATFTFGRDHWHTEQYIRRSGMRYTFLRDSFYLAAFPAMAGADRVLRGPAAGGRVAAVAHEDVADVAAGVLCDETGTHDGITYDVTGPEALSLTEIAETLGRFAGRTVSYLPETSEEAFASRAGYGAADWEVNGWVTSYEAIGAGEMDIVSDTVDRLTGQHPQGIVTFLERNPASYAHLLPSV